MPVIPSPQAAMVHLVEHPDNTAKYVMRALAVAGVQTEWDSETIEVVLAQLQLALPANTPPVGATGANNEYLDWWRRAADQVGVEYDDE